MADHGDLGAFFYSSVKVGRVADCQVLCAPRRVWIYHSAKGRIGAMVMVYTNLVGLILPA